MLRAIQALDKQTFCLEAIQKFVGCDKLTDKAKLGLIEVVTSELLTEMKPEVAAIKAAA